MKVVLAETAGICMGVDLALKKLGNLVEDKGSGKNIFTLGPIIHNPQVIEDFAQKGVRTASEPSDISSGSAVVIRAHGVPKETEQDLSEHGAQITDATCPKVKRAQILIEKQTAEGRTLLLYGEEDHPEVKGLLSYAAGDTFVFDSEEELDEYVLVPGKKYCLAAQTTQDKAIFNNMANKLGACRDCDVTILQTICDATRHRQDEAVRIAKQVDFMVVVGGYNSGNTRRLAKVVADQNTPCLHVETAEEIPAEKLKGYKVIGLTAGASTPKKIIREVRKVLESL